MYMRKITEQSAFTRRENFRLEREGIDENTGEKEYCMEWKREYEKSI